MCFYVKLIGRTLIFVYIFDMTDNAPLRCVRTAPTWINNIPVLEVKPCVGVSFPARNMGTHVMYASLLRDTKTEASLSINPLNLSTSCWFFSVPLSSGSRRNFVIQSESNNCVIFPLC